MDISVRNRSSVQVLQLRGDLRLGDAVDKFRETTEELIAAGESRFVLNLTEIRMIDSSGIGALMRLLTSASKQNGGVRLVNPSEFAIKTLKLVGLLRLFEVFDDENLAVESFH